MCEVKLGLRKHLELGNIYAKRDWGYAKDYVEGMWKMLQQKNPEDFVIATGSQYSVRQFIEWSAEELGIEIEFNGSGVNEVGIVTKIKGNNAPAVNIGDVIVKVDSRYFRPAEVETLLGNPSNAKAKLGWMPKITIKEMCSEMVKEDLESARKTLLLKENGF